MPDEAPAGGSCAPKTPPLPGAAGGGTNETWRPIPLRALWRPPWITGPAATLRWLWLALIAANALFLFAVAGVFVTAGGFLVVTRLSGLAEHGMAPELGESVAPAVWVARLFTWQTLILLAAVTCGLFLLGVIWSRALRRELAAQTAGLQESQERLALAAREAIDGLWDWDVATGKVHFSPQWKAMLGLTEEDVKDRIEEWIERIHPDDRDQVQAALEAHQAGHTSHFESEHRVRHRDGRYRWMLCRGVCLRDRAGRPTRMAGSQIDITERRTAEEQLLHDAFHDQLTGLPNRALFLDRVGGALARAQRDPDKQFAVLFFDLDRFKVINDTLGHAVGDQVLASVAERLSRCVRPGDTVARLGGDEFAVLLDDITGRTAATEFANRIIETLARPFLVADNEVYTTASIGIASNRTGYTLAEDMLRDADTAMYRAKHLGKARHQVFDTAMHAQAMRQLLLENDLRKALERHELTLLFQPIVNIQSRRAAGFEALLRWNHPQWGAVPLKDFLPLAEETGLIIAMGQWAVEEACAQMARWRDALGDTAQAVVSVNLSARQVAQAELPQQFMEALDRHTLPLSALRVEVTEAVVMEHINTGGTTLQHLKDVGVAVDIDDFGTGYSSLSCLHRFPVDRVKIDSSCVAAMLTDSHGREMVEAIVASSRSLGMEPVAEGVEIREQLTMLQDMGCTLAQGFLLGKPAPAQQALDWLASGIHW